MKNTFEILGFILFIAILIVMGVFTSIFIFFGLIVFGVIFVIIGFAFIGFFTIYFILNIIFGEKDNKNFD